MGEAMPDSLTERELEILRYVADGLSDREIGQRLFLSLNTVKWHNRQIYSKLNVGNRKQAVAQAREEGLFERQADGPVVSGTVALKHNLPAQGITSFVGREREIADVRRLLESTRLLTLTGPGGVGKTRLALRVASSMLDSFEDGVYLVELGLIRDAALVLSAIAHVLDVSEMAGEPLTETLMQAVRNRQILLVLDNFEQVLDAASFLSELLDAAPGLILLATSRERLHLYGEQVYPLPPLEPVDAVELFGQRARAVRPDFVSNDEDLSAVEQICARLDGLPLAIELAAARITLLPPQTLLPRLESRLNELRGGMRDLPARQQTLRATADWSYDLLDAGEQMLFARLGVFAGGCTLEAAEAVCGEGLSIDLFDGLESLLNKSLLWQQEGVAGEPRFLMLEALREYALERLEERGEAQGEEMRRRHAEFCVAFAERAETERLGQHAVVWSSRTEQELDNLRAALGWSLADGDVVLGLRMVGALLMFWFSRDYLEGRRWAELALEQGRDAPQVVRVRALHTGSQMAYFLGDYEQAGVMCQEALDLSREVDDRRNMAWSTVYLGGVKSALGEYGDSEVLSKQALALFREEDDRLGISYTLNSLGELVRLQGDYEQAKMFYEEGIAVRRESGLQIGSAPSYNLATVARHLGDDKQARMLFEETLEISLTLGHKGMAADSLVRLAGLLAEDGQSVRAARLLGAAEVAREALGHHMEPVDRPDYERDVATVRAQLDEAALEVALAEGRAMSLEEAVAYALGKGG